MAAIVCFRLFLLISIAGLTSGACPIEFTQYGNDCYKAFQTLRLDQPKALSFCQEMGGQLPSVETADKNNFIRSLLLNTTDGAYREFWTYGSDLMKEGEWMWLPSKTPMTFTAWNLGEPNAYGGGEDCVVLALTGRPSTVKWNDQSCQRALNFICQIPMDSK